MASFRPRPSRRLRRSARRRGVDGDLFFDAIFGPYDGDTDHPWHRLERGEVDFMTAREGIMELAKAQGFEADPIELFTKMGEGGGMRQEVIDLATRINRRGTKRRL